MSPPELSHGTGSRRALLERQATVPSAGKSHPELLPASHPSGACGGSHAPHMGEQQQRGSRHPLDGMGFSPGAWMVGWQGE